MNDMTNDSMAAEIARSAERLYADHVDRSVREAVEAGQWPAALWQRITDSGFDRALATEACDGFGLDWAAAYPLLRGLGYWQVPVPLAETMIGAQLLSMAGLDVPEGPLTLIEQGLDDSLTLQDGLIHGEAPRVAWARHCGHAVVSTADGRIGLVDLHDRATVELTPRNDHAGEPLDSLRLTGARLVSAAPSPLEGLDAPVRVLGAVARSIAMVGALESLLEQSVQYANDRVQFGRPIGKNQAIQQPLAVLAGDTAAARMAARVAAQDAPSAHAAHTDAATRAMMAGHAAFSAAVAKIRVGEAATRATSIAHQTHGAIGFTQDHALHFATRRLWAWREAHGSDAWWAGRLGRAAITARSGGFWSSLTQRHFASMTAGR